MNFLVHRTLRWRSMATSSPFRKKTHDDFSNATHGPTAWINNAQWQQQGVSSARLSPGQTAHKCALPFDHQLSCTIIDYHQVSFILSLFKFFMIVDDSFSRLTTRMIVHDMIAYDSSVSCFGSHRPDSGQYFLKCFTVHAEHFVVSGSVLHSQFFHQFQLHSALVSPFDPFPCPSSLPRTLSRFIFRTFLEQIDYQKTSYRPLPSRKIDTFTSLSYGTPFSVHIFTKKERGTRCSRDFARATAGELSSTNTNFLGRLAM